MAWAADRKVLEQRVLGPRGRQEVDKEAIRRLREVGLERSKQYYLLAFFSNSTMIVLLEYSNCGFTCFF